MSTDDHDERTLYERGDSPSEERAREHAPASLIDPGVVKLILLVRCVAQRRSRPKINRATTMASTIAIQPIFSRFSMWVFMARRSAQQIKDQIKTNNQGGYYAE